MILARAKNFVKFEISDLNFKFLVGKVFHISDAPSRVS